MSRPRLGTRNRLLVTFAGVAAISLAAQAHAQPTSRLFIVDFEEYAEGTEISDQYAALGVTFAIKDDPVALPIIAVEGTPVVGFFGSGDDTPMASGSGGLTDPVVGSYDIGRDIKILFDPPVTSVRLFVVDIDGGDVVTLRAFDGTTEVDFMTRQSGQTGTGNGVSTEFAVAAASITSVVIDVPASIGYAIDFLTFTRPCAGAECSRLIEVSQESAPGACDFDTHVLGTLLPFPATGSTANFYAYDVPDGSSWNGQSLALTADRSHLLLANTTDGLSLVIVHDIPNDPDGGQAEMRFELSGDPDGVFRSVEDDPDSDEEASGAAGYTGSRGDSLFTSAHLWSPCCTDGLALSGLNGAWSMIVQFTEVDGDPDTPPVKGLTEWVCVSADLTEVPLVHIPIP
jgi:hypothetical protein